MIFLKSPGKPDHTDDDELLKRYRDTGDMALLARLYEKYMHLVYGVCLKYLKDDEASKDAVMQIFEELIIKVTRHDVRQFKSWLYVLSRNYCLMQLRAGKKMQGQPFDEFMGLADDTHPDNEYLEGDLAVLARCKQKLPKPQQICVDLFYTDEQCYKDIANHTGYTMNEVKSFIQNGKRNLRICLEKNRER